MARARDPNRDKAHELYKQHDGAITNRAIAEQLGIDEKKVAVWKQRDKWNVVQQKKQPAKKARSPSKKAKEEIEEEIAESGELTDKQRFFWLYYLKYFNATKAYQKAYECTYEAAHSNAYRMMANEGIKNETARMKKERAEGILLDAQSILQKYIDIAFADISDFITFGRKEQQVMTMYGPLYEKDKKGKVDKSKPIMEIVNYIDLKESAEEARAPIEVEHGSIRGLNCIVKVDKNIIIPRLHFCGRGFFMYNFYRSFN